MGNSNASHPFSRREFLTSAGAFVGMTGAAVLGSSTAWGDSPKSLDPVDPNLRYGITGALWGGWVNGNLRMWTDVEKIASDAARFGLQGLELYGSQVGSYLKNPLALKRMCNAAGLTLIDVGDLPGGWHVAARGTVRRAAGGPPPNPWISTEGNAELIARIVSFARDFLAPCGCDHWKTNVRVSARTDFRTDNFS